ERRGIDRDRIAAGRWVDRRFAADDLGLLRADANVGERMRYLKFAAQLEHPLEKAVEAARRQVENARDDLRLGGDGDPVVYDNVRQDDRVGEAVMGVEPRADGMRDRMHSAETLLKGRG